MENKCFSMQILRYTSKPNTPLEKDATRKVKEKSRLLINTDAGMIYFRRGCWKYVLDNVRQCYPSVRRKLFSIQMYVSAHP